MGDSPRDDKESSKQVMTGACEAVEDVKVDERCGCCQRADEIKRREAKTTQPLERWVRGFAVIDAFASNASEHADV